MYMQNFLGFDALAAGARFLPLSGLILVAAPLGGVLIDRIGPRPPRAADRVARRGRTHAPRRGDRGYRRRAGRQL